MEQETLFRVRKSDLKRNHVDGTVRAFEAMGAIGIKAEQQQGDAGTEKLWYVEGQLVGTPVELEVDIGNL